MAELLRFSSVPQAQCLDNARATGARADGSVQAGSAQAMKETMRPGEVQQSHGAGVTVGQNGLGAEIVRRAFQPGGDGIQGFVPGNSLEFSFAFRASSLLRIEQAVRRVFALQI